jgi:DNA-binding transcriptional ArsR family regulator
MQTASDTLFSTLADPTRRALFERLARHGEQTVHALTDQSGVSQPMVSRHLGALKLAGLVIARRAGRETHYRALPGALAPLVDWMSIYNCGFKAAANGFTPSSPYSSAG